ncbi:DNA-deoxyinosine glycosylase [Silanimonas algicola]
MTVLSALPPRLGAAPRALVLGSMPGVASLRAGQYYAHPRNAFWPLMAALFGVQGDAPYEARIEALNARGVGLWDVLAACVRPGSLDAAIVPGSERPNDIAGLVAARPGIAVLALNGGTAVRLFERHVAPGLARLGRGPAVLRLPSTSPAHAALAFEAKRDAWRALAEAMERSPCA